MSDLAILPQRLYSRMYWVLRAADGGEGVNLLSLVAQDTMAFMSRKYECLGIPYAAQVAGLKGLPRRIKAQGGRNYPAAVPNAVFPDPSRSNLLLYGNLQIISLIGVVDEK